MPKGQSDLGHRRIYFHCERGISCCLPQSSSLGISHGLISMKFVLSIFARCFCTSGLFTFKTSAARLLMKNLPGLQESARHGDLIVRVRRERVAKYKHDDHKLYHAFSRLTRYVLKLLLSEALLKRPPTFPTSSRIWTYRKAASRVHAIHLLQQRFVLCDSTSYMNADSVPSSEPSEDNIQGRKEAPRPGRRRAKRVEKAITLNRHTERKVQTVTPRQASMIQMNDSRQSMISCLNDHRPF